MACETFSVIESCYRYDPRQNAEREQITDWLNRLIDNHRNHGVGLCYLYPRCVKSVGWNHQRIYLIYREWELNLRIKPKRRLKRDIPESPAIPQAITKADRWTSCMTVSKTAATPGCSMSLMTSTVWRYASRLTSYRRPSGSTKQFVTSGCSTVAGPASKRFVATPHSGCGSTITTASVWP